MVNDIGSVLRVLRGEPSDKKKPDNPPSVDHRGVADLPAAGDQLAALRSRGQGMHTILRPRIYPSATYPHRLQTNLRQLAPGVADDGAPPRRHIQDYMGCFLHRATNAGQRSATKSESCR